jgi:phosphoesterase RecJ-like protein
MDQRLREIAQALLMADRVTLVSHVAPDGDTLGSACALALALEGIGKKTVRYCADPVPRRLAYLPGSNRYISSLKQAGASDLIVVLDCAAPDRMGPAASLLTSGTMVMVLDHHGTNRGFGNLPFVQDCSSTSEIVFDLLEIMGVTVTDQIADCLYTGMVTDTGRFSFPGVTGHTLRLAAKAVEAGANYTKICQSQFQQRTLAATCLLGAALHSLEMHYDGRLALMHVTTEDFVRCHGSQEDMEGIVNYASEIEGVEIGVMLYPASNRWKVSLRAGGGARVDGIAGLLAGGGHAKAAGGRAEGSLDDARAQVIAAVEQAGVFA